MLTEEEKTIGEALAYCTIGLKRKYKFDIYEMRVSEDGKIAMIPFENPNHKFLLKIVMVE